MLVKKLAMQSMATNLIAPPRSRRDLRLRPRSVRQSSLDRMSSQKKKKRFTGLRYQLVFKKHVNQMGRTH